VTGLDPARTLAWMREHGALLREMVADEPAGPLDDDEGPAGDPAIRAHLRFLAAAIEATAAPALAGPLAGFADDLPAWLADNRELYEEHLEAGAGAIALEQHLQYGARPGSDPSLDVALRRRLRINGWVRLFLLGLELRLGPSADGLAAQVLAAVGERQRELGRLIVTLDRQAKAQAARRAGGEAPADLGIQDEIGQAAVVQAHVRILVDALGATLPAG
jgi:hypothetical protein